MLFQKQGRRWQELISLFCGEWIAVGQKVQVRSRETPGETAAVIQKRDGKEEMMA